MSHPSRVRTLARLAAVASSVVLVGLYVVYRTGAQAQQRDRVFYGSKSAPARLTQAAAPTTTTAATNPTTTISGSDLLMISSSKSGAIFKPEVFSGSKSAQIIRPADNILGSSTVVVTTQPATRAATKPSYANPYPATTQTSSAVGAGFRLNNAIGAEYAVASDMCSPPSTRPAEAP